ncbi:MAG: hypothetical protein C4518_09885 [Desulfobacteraceae bacterium]|nr:MAG: hypothetical protein C4518_09885 [Desulfobacteraceae bacterium]
MLLLKKKLHSSIYRLFLPLLLMVFLAGPVQGEQESSAPVEDDPKEAQPSENKTRDWLDRLSDPSEWEIWHRDASKGVMEAGERIDHFFGDERLDEENRKTRLRLGLGPRWHEHDGASLLTDIKLRLVLPQLKNRFQLVVDDSFESDEPGTTAAYSDAVKDSEPDTSLRYIIKETERRRLSADAGVRFSSPSQLFGRLRGRIIVPYPVWEMRLTNTAAWFTDDGFVYTPEIRFTRPVWDDWLFRSSSRVTWEENENGVKPAQMFSLYRALSSRRGYRISLGAYWPETPHAHEAVYSSEFSYRQLIHSRWLFVEVTPGMEFPQIRHYDFTPYIEVKFEVVFGDEE